MRVRVFRPSQAVWSRVVALAAVVLVLSVVGAGVAMVLDPEVAYVRTRLPVHALFVAFGLGYLLFLRKALFVSLAADCEIRANDSGIAVRVQERSGSFRWEEVQRIQPGDIHLTVRAGGEVFALPFVPRSQQRELYHMYFERRGLSPNRKPMTTFPLRRRGL